MPISVAILISGRGSNMKALADYAAKDDVPAKITLVLADKPADGLNTADEMGIPAIVIAADDYGSKTDHEAAVMKAIDASGADVVFLAGYMRLLSGDFCRHYQDRLFNIHPSLLPRHKGLDTHAKAIAAGDKTHGCSVHLVTEAMDDGTVLAQRKIDVLAADTEKTLAARVLAEEHLLYPALLNDLATKRLVIKNGIPTRLTRPTLPTQ